MQAAVRAEMQGEERASEQKPEDFRCDWKCEPQENVACGMTPALQTVLIVGERRENRLGTKMSFLSWV